MLAATDMTCRVKELEQEVVVFNPKKEVIALVAISWAFQIITLCALTCFNALNSFWLLVCAHHKESSALLAAPSLV